MVAAFATAIATVAAAVSRFFALVFAFYTNANNIAFDLPIANNQT